MFTGIIAEIGTVEAFNKTKTGAEIRICCKKSLENAKIGDSIAVNGVCQTVIDLTETTFSAQISNETLNVTTFSTIKIGNKVNLESALSLKDKLDGHIVSGHVDNTAKLVSLSKNFNFYTMKFEISNDIKKYVVKKGSATINGISLTVANISNNVFECAIIPHTFENTNLKFLKVGDTANFEADMFAKYIENFLFNEKTTSIISENFLKENGF